MRRLYTSCIGVALALVVMPQCMAMDATTRQTDLGAGPIVAHITACLMANRSHVGAPCREPEVATTGNSAARVAKRLERAWFFVDMQDFDKARAETELALGVEPADLKARLLSARLALTVGDVDRAEADLKIAKNQSPDDPDVGATYAFWLQSRNADLESLHEFEAVVRTHPHHRFAREQRATLLMRLGQYAGALEDFNFIVDDNPPSANSLVRRSEAFLALGKPESGVADLSAAIKLEPGQFMLLAARADAYAQAGFSDLALRDYDAVLAMDHGAPLYVMFDNDRAKVMAKRANIYVGLRRFDDAAREMVAAIGLGGVPAILRTQVLLRRNGFSDVPLDGHDSRALRQALAACFGLNACFQGVMRAI